MTLIIELTNTSKIVQLEINGATVPARIWEGHTEHGIPVIAFIPRIAAERDADLAEFQRDLEEQAPPSAAVEAWPTRMVWP